MVVWRDESGGVLGVGEGGMAWHDVVGVYEGPAKMAMMAGMVWEWRPGQCGSRWWWSRMASCGGVCGHAGHGCASVPAVQEISCPNKFYSCFSRQLKTQLK